VNKNKFFPDIEGIDSLKHSRHSTQWVEESFDFDEKTQRQPSIPKTGRFVKSSLRSQTAWVGFTIMAIICATFIGRVFILQIIYGGEYSSLAIGNRVRTIALPSQRGLIFDAQGRQLAQNIPDFEVTVTPQYLPKDALTREQELKHLAALIDSTPITVRNMLEIFHSYSFEPIIIKNNLDYTTALSIQIEAANMPGVQIQEGSKRKYLLNIEPNGKIGTTSTLSLSHVLGYESKVSVNDLQRLQSQNYLPSDNIGETGVEAVYETVLRGTYGSEKIEVNAKGRKQNIISEIPSTPGQNIHLTIDAAMQAKMEQIMNTYMAKAGKTKGAAVVLDPNTGNILALVSLPGFNNNDFSGGISETNYKKYIQNPNHPLFNRAIAGTYPSGSTIKPAYALAALQDGIITPYTTVNSTGGIQTSGHFYPDWLAGGHGITNVRKALAQSVNTFFYYIGGGYKKFKGMGVNRMVAALKSFGFGTPLGIDLPGEAAGFLPSPAWKLKTKKQPWYIGDTYNLSIGQGDFLTTPLQIAFMTSAIAANGTQYKPRVVDAYTNPVTGKQIQIPPIKLRIYPIDKANMRIVQLGLNDCVYAVGGSCHGLSYLPFSAAAKTGTAQWSNIHDTHAWFTSYAPFNHPRIVVTVLIESAGEGSGISEPITEKFYAWWGQYEKKLGSPVDNK